MLEIVLSPRAHAFVKSLPWPTRRLLLPEIDRLGTPERFLELKEIVGRSPWLEGAVDPFIVQCRVMGAGETAGYGIPSPALLVADICRRDEIRAIGLHLIRQSDNPKGR